MAYNCNLLGFLDSCKYWVLLFLVIIKNCAISLILIRIYPETECFTLAILDLALLGHILKNGLDLLWPVGQDYLKASLKDLMEQKDGTMVSDTDKVLEPADNEDVTDERTSSSLKFL